MTENQSLNMHLNIRCSSAESQFLQAVPIPMKVVSDSDLIPVTHSDAKPVTVGAKRRWRSYSA